MANQMLVYLAFFLWTIICSEGEEVCHTYNTSDYGQDLVRNWHFQYPWPPLPAGRTRFNMTIKGNNDAYVILSSTPGGHPNDYEKDGDVGTPKILIGGHGNKWSAFSCALIDHENHSDWRWFNTSNILNPDEAREFYFEFDNNRLQVGVVGECPFINVDCTCCAGDIEYVGVATGWGGNAEWTYCGEYTNCQTHSTSDYGPLRVENTYFQYPWPQLPVGTTRLEVSIRGTRDAYIVLSPTPGGIPVDEAVGDNGYPKIVIDSGNGDSANAGFLCNSRQQDWNRETTGIILDPNEAKKIYIEFGDSNLAVGLVDAAQLLFTKNYSNNCIVDVKYFGVASGYGGSADWTYCDNSESTTTTIATRTTAFTTEPQHQFTECSTTSTTDNQALSTDDSFVSTKDTSMDVTLNYDTSSEMIGNAIATEPQPLFGDSSTSSKSDTTLSNQDYSVTTKGTIPEVTADEETPPEINSPQVTHFDETSVRSGFQYITDVNQEYVLDELLNKSSFGQKIQFCAENEACDDGANMFFQTWDEFIAVFAGELSTNRYESTYFDSYVFSMNNDDISDTPMYAISNDKESYQYQLTIPSKAFEIDSLVVASVLKFDHPSMKHDGTQTIQMGSKVLSIIAIDKETKLTVPLTIEEMFFVTYKLSSAVEVGMNVSCQYITSAGNWSDDGCWVITSNDTHVTCGYDHVTSFAVLMQVVDVGELPSIHVKILYYLSYITMSISMICLVTAICIYVISKLYKKTRIALHMNLAVALFTAQLLFVTGIDAKYKNSCIAVTVLLHYLWLVVFAWMLVEAINLFLKVNPSINLKMKLSICMPVAWGIPLVIALITLGVRIEDYARAGEKCWLPIEGGVIWAFAAFALIITCVNIVFLIITIRKFLALKTNMDRSKAARLKASLRAIAILAPILGITWIFGCLQFDQTSSIVFSYLFIIGNGLQGLFVFIAQCLLDEDVRTFLRQKSGRGAVEQTPPTQETNN